MTSFLDLPAELILHALWFLDLTDVLASQLSHRSLHAIIKDSVLLKYFSALKVAGMEDNRLCLIGSMSERLRLLDVHEKAWAGHLIDFSRKIAVPQGLQLVLPIGLDGGMYFFSDLNSSSSLHYVSLPSPISDRSRWDRIDVDNEIVMISLAVYEHDLIAIITRVPGGQGSVESAEIFFFEASTGNSHPLAQIPKISISHIPIEIKIADNHLSSITYESVEIYEWKTGVLKTTISATGRTFQRDSSCLFLSPKVLLLPNMQNNTLEFWDIPESHIIDPTQAFLNGALALPPIKNDSTVVRILCHGEKSSGSYSNIPFYPSSADAIAILKIGITAKSGQFADFQMVVHYRSLLQIYSTSLSAGGEFRSTRADVLPWDDWGPPITRLISSESDQGLCSVSANQRYALRNKGQKSVVLDFNPVRIQRLSAAISKHTDDEKEDTSVITNESYFNSRCFQNRVTSRLPYARHTFPNISTFQWVAIDNERLVELGYDINNGTEELEVLHIGQAASDMVKE